MHGLNYILNMSKSFFRALIGENLSLGAQFRLNWEDWNFRRPNKVFLFLIII
jgi:hypothetical protein